MSFRQLCNIGYKREAAPEHLSWKKLGRLFWNGTEARILLHGWRTGTCIGKPVLDDSPPFLQGDILHNTGDDKLFVGFITSSEDGIYTVTLECCPIGNVPGVSNGMWFTINTEEKESYVEHSTPESEAIGADKQADRVVEKVASV